MYRLFAFFELDKVNNEQLDFWLRCLPGERRDKALRYRREIDRKVSVVSYLLLAYALFEEYNIKNFRLAYTETGKPYLPDHTDIHFNISHCEKGCICGISDQPIGVDIQDIRPVARSVIDRCCSSRERGMIEQSANPVTEFCKIWTMKEAYLKMVGTGIAQELMATDTTRILVRNETQNINGCCIAIATTTFDQEETICLT